MRVLVVGAGVIGSLYAAKLAAAAGCEVSLVARGRRVAELAGGLRIREAGEIDTVPVRVLTDVPRDEDFDYVLVAVRLEQAGAALRLAAGARSPSIVTMINCAGDYAGWIELLGKGRLLPAFPGAAGWLGEGGVLNARATPAGMQRTTLGEPHGARTGRVRILAAQLRAAGFPTAMSNRMSAWQLTHAAFVSALADAINAAGDADHRQVADNRGLMEDAARTFRDRVRRMRRGGIRATPAKFELLSLLPVRVSADILAALLRPESGDWMMVRHARSARAEMDTLRESLEARLATLDGKAPRVTP
ncbi:ketopantoate reductase family protein [Brevibacterium daeguense]|uniref:ketopantoate reductase family protein n=1 Tax=Brevibacterium daeguense TaxID=909936 RepID=UPI001F191059|nr:2-dehydropantoate 2-reductase N-terminal domain-containing protein [Brevibacterium daeguense]